MMFKPSSPDVADVCLFDWQYVSTGPAMLDVAYLLTGSLSVTERRRTESALISEYTRTLQNAAASGASLPSESALVAAYELAALCPLVWSAVIACTGVDSLVTVTVGAPNDSNAAARSHSRQLMVSMTVRFVQAALDLRSLDKLNAALRR
eukprot:CAMPEP_0114553848 /NCGR_PEP_ID=MMETSP0114-20121206/7886_1 /TAXON_ID=31324 /ORGANISM="Goniomonas sp, Strain m" /LENGTH=149 /DNA_ID=CAMNT_0001738837 /DNA_START=82 /DNA_END=531 /DNA_ORIENTATION=+